MGDEDAGDAALLVEPADPLAELDADLGVEGAEGLVEEQERGPRGEGAGEGDALPLAARELGRVAAAERVELHEAEQLVDDGVDLFLRALPDLEAKGDVLAHRHVTEERVVLEDEADGAVLHALAVGDDAAQEHLAAIRLFEPGDDAEDGALPAAARPEERDQLARGTSEGDVVDDLGRAERLFEVADDDARGRGGISRAQRSGRLRRIAPGATSS